jgi:AbrB family looped-hinge helix DNA binding protein
LIPRALTRPDTILPLGKNSEISKEAMTTATLTSKGQVTIPKEIRDRLMLHTGDRIDFTVTDNGDVLLKPPTRRVDDLFGRL